MGENKLAGLLRRYRRERGLTGCELADGLGVAQGTISKMESGRLDPDLDYLSKFIQTLRVRRKDAAEMMRLAGVVPGGATPDRVLQYLPVDFLHTDFSRRRQETIALAEARSADIRVFNPSLIPGLLQSEEYSRHVIELSGVRRRDSVRRAVQTRVRRQDLLHNRDKQFTFVISEAALMTRVGPQNILMEQFEHLRQLSCLRGVKLGLITFDAVLTVPLPPAFYLLDRRVYIELPHGDLWLLERSNAFGTYHELFNRLIEHAVFGDAFTSKLGQLTERFIQN
jgi:transcriptional regulator with XRE-family HTH domain